MQESGHYQNRSEFTIPLQMSLMFHPSEGLAMSSVADEVD
jgi:hypothetical protein